MATRIFRNTLVFFFFFLMLYKVVKVKYALFHFRYKDAVIVSPHKFVGGPGTPGIDHVIYVDFLCRNLIKKKTHLIQSS
jgi:hypothetical protein